MTGSQEKDQKTTKRVIADEIAAAARLHRAGEATDDLEVIGAAEAKLLKIASKIGLPLNDPLIRWVCHQPPNRH